MSDEFDEPTEDLPLKVLLSAYAQGYFPMADPRDGRVHWYTADPRGVIPLDGLRVPRSLAKVLRSGRFEIVADRNFEAVIRACAQPRRDDNDTWINESIVRAYLRLHRLGFAHSVEAYRDGGLVGGLYGVALRGAFFGESMFVRPELGGSDASKACLVRLVEHLNRRGYVLLDTQMCTPHTARMGCIEIPRREYLRKLRAAMDRADVSWGRFEAD